MMICILLISILQMILESIFKFVNTSAPDYHRIHPGGVFLFTPADNCDLINLCQEELFHS